MDPDSVFSLDLIFVKAALSQENGFNLAGLRSVKALEVHRRVIIVREGAYPALRCCRRAGVYVARWGGGLARKRVSAIQIC